jgi:tetratricopeptide (TPR) repeat protein
VILRDKPDRTAALALRGSFEDARAQMRHVLTISRQLCDQTMEGYAQLNTGWIFACGQAYDDAVSHASQALDLFRAAGDQAGQARALNAIGWHQIHLGNYGVAVTYCEQALTVNLAIEDRLAEGDTWDSLGCAYYRLGNHQQALNSFGRALDAYRNLGVRKRESVALIHLGDTYQSANRPSHSAEAWQLALTILEELRDPAASEVREKLLDENL